MVVRGILRFLPRVNLEHGSHAKVEPGVDSQKPRVNFFFCENPSKDIKSRTITVSIKLISWI